MSKKKVIGIDIGGTNIKMAFVDHDGQLLKKQKIPTASLIENKSFSYHLAKKIKKYRKQSKTVIQEIGIGCPAILCSHQRQCLHFANLSQLNGIHLLNELESYFPDIQFFLENDANAAAFGEFVFAKNHNKKSFLFITLGTGVGGGAVIHGKIFHGASGNALEVGHIIVHNGKTLESMVGKRGIVNIYQHLKTKSDKVVKNPEEISSLCKSGNQAAIDTFKKVGEVLGYGLTSSIRILDIHNIIIGGGVASIYPFIQKSMYQALEESLDTYYLQDMEIICSELKNEAGILGAAALCFQKSTRQ